MLEFISVLVQPSVQNYLFEHERDDVAALILKKKEILGLPAPILASQLNGRSTAKNKLPTWYKTKGVVYPPALNLEQCSSEATATFKTSVLKAEVKNLDSVVDLTGGLGVDTYSLSTLFTKTHYVDTNETLLAIARHNHFTLGSGSIVYHPVSAEQFVESTSEAFDLVYIDPSRRDQKSRKVFRLADCAPDITTLQHAVFRRSEFLLVKASPLLDIQQSLRELISVKKIFVVSVENECKELLFLAEKNYSGNIQIEAVDLYNSGLIRNSFSFSSDEEKESTSRFSEPLSYLYEPNAAIMKAGAFKLVGERHHIAKLSANTHLYTSNELISDFPGRIFKIENLNPKQKELHDLLTTYQANVLTRNYPLRPEELKRKLHVRDGGDKYVVGFSSEKRKHVAVCSRIQ